ncbi:MAG TPA: hypothetical protein PLZ15_05675 [Melioribacteraceae bacterium]|nr:hypothetical protein [Melioribacteraceae bacterium]
MKKFNSTIIVILLIAGISGCKKEYKTVTKVNPDGSCERTVIARVDSSGLKDVSFPFPQDSSWNVEFKLMEGDTQKVFVARKTFDDVNAIDNNIAGDGKISTTLNLEKNFRWFFTYLRYTETYKSYNRFNRIALKDFLSSADYALYEAGDTSGYLSDKLDSYFEENLFQEFFSQLMNEIGKLNDPLITEDLFDKRKNELKDSLLAGPGDTQSIMRSIKNIYKITRVEYLSAAIERIMQNINNGLEFMGGADGDYINEVIMPGIILNTNADALEGNKAGWKFNEKRFFYSDFSMTIESRIINMWAIYITAGFVLLIVLLLLTPRLKKSGSR